MDQTNRSRLERLKGMVQRLDKRIELMAVDNRSRSHLVAERAALVWALLVLMADEDLTLGDILKQTRLPKLTRHAMIPGVRPATASLHPHLRRSGS